MKTRVMKFGGSTFSTLGEYQKIAKKLHSVTRDNNQKLVVVVSAFPNLTESLRKLLTSVNNFSSDEVTDSIITLGDSISAGLLRAACESIEGLNVTTLFGHQIGIITNSNFSRAKVIKEKTQNIVEALNTNNIVIVPGGQAIDSKMRPSWLGKNSSDLTAVLLAKILHLTECEIYSDVDGVYSIDPNQNKSALLMKNISYDAAIQMSKCGAKVIHFESVAEAKKNNILIKCFSNKSFKQGTIIGTNQYIDAVVYDKLSQVISLSSDEAISTMSSLLDQKNIPYVIISHKIVVTCGHINLAKVLKKGDFVYNIIDLKLVTIFNKKNKTMIFKLIKSSDASSYSNQLHDKLITIKDPFKFDALKKETHLGTQNAR